MRKQTPQEKKIRNYQHQRKNTYGENNKSSRRAIAKRKAWVNRSYRRSVTNKLRTQFIENEDIDSTVKSVKRHNWRKFKDQSLIESLEHKWSESSRSRFLKKRSCAQKVAIQRLKKSNVETYFKDVRDLV